MEDKSALLLIRESDFPRTLPAEGAVEDILLPQVYARPRQPFCFPRKIDVDALVKTAKNYYNQKKLSAFENIYTKLEIEFRPVISWAISCWDYLLTTEGVRFVPKNAFQKWFERGFYRAFEYKDFIRFVKLTFKKCILEYDKGAHQGTFAGFIKRNFWQMILDAYRALKRPQDERYRYLTSYSYLRCVPYQFLNPYHENRVKSLLMKLPSQQQRIVDLYFLNFFTDGAAARESGMPKSLLLSSKRKALSFIRRLDPIVHALLLQLERY